MPFDQGSESTHYAPTRKLDLFEVIYTIVYNINPSQTSPPTQHKVNNNNEVRLDYLQFEDQQIMQNVNMKWQHKST